MSYVDKTKIVDSALDELNISAAGEANVIGPLTDTELRAVPVPVSISGTVDTEFGVTLALADNEPNPSVPFVGSFNSVFDGATWDRMRGDSNNGVLVDLGLNNDVVETNSAAILADTTAIKTAVEIIDNAIAGSEMQVDVVGALPAGTNLIGNVGHGKTIKTVTSGATPITADTDIVALVPAKRIKVISFALFTDSTTQNIVIFESNGTDLWTVPLQAAAAGSIFGANLACDAPSFLFATAQGEKLNLNVSSAQNVWWSVSYFDDDAT